MSRSLSILLFLALVCPAYAQTANQPANKPARQAKKPAHAAADFLVSGVVINALTREPVARAQLSIGISEKSGSLETTLSGADGRFAFLGLRPGKYRLMARGRGFALQGLDEHEGFFTGVAVGPGLDAQNITFRLRPDSSIIGAISDSDNEPIQGAQVMLFHGGIEGGESNTFLQTQTGTDDQGHYRFEHLVPGTYFIGVTAEPWYAQTPDSGMRTYVKGSTGAPAEDSSAQPAGSSALDVAYPLTFYPGVTDAAGAGAINLQPGDQTTADVSLAAVPAVQVRVGEAGSKGQLTGVSLMRAFGSSLINVSAQNGTSSPGEIVLNGLAPGRYILSLDAHGEQGGPSAKTIDVAGDTEIDAGDISAVPHVSGTAQLGGHPAANTTIRLRNRASGQSFLARTSENGSFEFEQPGMETGTYEIAVFDTQEAAVSAISATGGEVHGHSLKIVSAGAVHLNLTLSQGLARVEGLALRDGKPAAGTMVLLVPQKLEDDSTLVRRDQSDSDGTFALLSVLPGKYTVVAIANGWGLEWMNPAVLQPYLKAGTPVEVDGARKYSVKVRVQ